MPKKPDPLAPKLIRAATLHYLTRHDGTRLELSDDEARELGVLGERLQALVDDPNADPKVLVGAWAKARRRWTELTNEPLISDAATRVAGNLLALAVAAAKKDRPI